MNLIEGLAAQGSEFLLYGITPPTPGAAALGRIPQLLSKLAPLALDGLVVYDLVDEAGRSGQSRPFPFRPAMDPAEFRARYLADTGLPTVLCRSVGKATPTEHRAWLANQDPTRTLAVLIGAGSAQEPVLTTLPQAWELRAAVQPRLPVGGIVIPERHRRDGAEPTRMLAKQAAGCSFWLTQLSYDPAALGEVLRGYAQACARAEVRPVPIIITFALCGSPRTLDLLAWLGVSVPAPSRARLLASANPLADSADLVVTAAAELARQCRELGLRFGFTVESLGSGQRDIEASLALLSRLRTLLVSPQL